MSESKCSDNESECSNSESECSDNESEISNLCLNSDEENAYKENYDHFNEKYARQWNGYDPIAVLYYVCKDKVYLEIENNKLEKKIIELEKIISDQKIKIENLNNLDILENEFDKL